MKQAIYNALNDVLIILLVILTILSLMTNQFELGLLSVMLILKGVK